MMTVDKDPANYVLAPTDVPLPAEYTTVETIGNAKLARRPGNCSPLLPRTRASFPSRRAGHVPGMDRPLLVCLLTLNL